MSDPKRRSVLIVDDEKMNLDVLSHILSDEYTVYVAKSGRMAIKQAISLRPDLILLDIIMPDFNGYDVINQLKCTEEISQIPVIFITGLSGVVDEERGLLMGAADYITKPFNATVVKARVRTQMRLVEQIQTINELGMLDSLTGLLNKKIFFFQVRIEWFRSQREKLPVSLLVIDLEPPSQTPDSIMLYDNQTIRKYADSLINVIKRATDLLARIDNMKFGLFLPNTIEEGAKTLAQSIHKKIQIIPDSMEDVKKEPITVSVKTASAYPSPNNTLKEFVKKVGIEYSEELFGEK